MPCTIAYLASSSLSLYPIPHRAVGNLKDVCDLFHGSTFRKHLKDLALPTGKFLSSHSGLGSRLNLSPVARPICGVKRTRSSRRVMNRLQIIPRDVTF
jgi:hypothetical protein